MKKMIVMAILLVNMVAAVFGTDFEERIRRETKPIEKAKR